MSTEASFALEIRMTSRLPAAIVLTLSFGLLTPSRTLATRPLAFAHVQHIIHGLVIQLPNRRSLEGKLNMALFDGYGLMTQRHQMASIRFRDGTTLYINERTHVVLSDSHVTVLERGEVDEVHQPGTIHDVQTATAVAAAVGSNFDVAVVGNRTVVIVDQGQAVVRNAKGTVRIGKNQQTVVAAQRAPSAAQSVNAQIAIAWTHPLTSP